jgi:hypothetical protein
MVAVAAGEFGRYGADRPSDDYDGTREARELPRQPDRRDFVAEPMTQRDIEVQDKVFRGELRWRGDRWVESEPYDYVQREDRARRMQHEVKLPDRVLELPDARDVILNIGAAEIDRRKFNEYSMNPQHPGNGGKADGWRALGYEVDDPSARRQAATELRELIGRHLLWNGKVDETHETVHGRHYKVLNGFIGPNDRHATLVTCWRVAEPGGREHPQLITTWVQPHRDKERDG